MLGARLLEVVSKPIPVAALAVMAVVMARDTRDGGARRYAAFMAAGLVLSSGGDLVLEHPHGFTAGLFLFLLAHLAYTAAFLGDERRPRLLRALPFAAWVTMAAAWLWPGIPAAVRLPVAVYMAAIAVMMWRAAARLGDGAPGAATALVGALVFAVSDTLIAVNRFHAPLAGAPFAIILSYWVGQAALAASVAQRGRGSSFQVASP